jgi:FMN phosphatase YigB (HAD superfamily)
MKGMKEKPAPTMFYRALEMDGIDASNALMVGNKQSVDISGAKKAGLRAAIVDRLGTGPSGKEDIYVQNLLELGLYLF